jgi:mannosyltransferase OCH1-like enzyme
MATWQLKNPDWVYHLWTNDKDCGGANGPGGPWKNQAQIDAMPELCGKADLMRYEILERWGGVYVDADSRCVKALDDRFLTPTCWAAYENEVYAPGYIANGTLGSEAGGALMKDMVKACAGARVTEMPAWKCVGPCLLTIVAAKHPELKIFEARTFYGRHWSGKPAPGDAVPYAEQFWGSTNRGLYK